MRLASTKLAIFSCLAVDFAAAACASLSFSVVAAAQSAAAPKNEPDPAAYPAAVKTIRYSEGYRYVTPSGLTLYLVDPRVARPSRGTIIEYCVAACAANFKPLSAAPHAEPVGLWRPVDSSSGRIWTYRQSPVFTFNADRRPGDVGGSGFENALNPIDYVPHPPAYIAPPAATAHYAKGTWFLADRDGRGLFTAKPSIACTEACEPPEPFRAGSAALPVGAWTKVHAGGFTQWAWRKQPVFVVPLADGMPSAPGFDPILLGSK